MERREHIIKQVIEAEEADADVTLLCPCKSGELRDVQCHNCIQYPASCKACFAQAHVNNPFHWAKVWDANAGHFRSFDLSALGYPLRIGHHGQACEHATAPVRFEVFADTGPHALLIQFCGHFDKVGNKVDQLLEARLFPCSFDDTKSAIVFNVLRQFQILHLESKIAAFDYCGALRRLADNSFTETVPVSLSCL